MEEKQRHDANRVEVSKFGNAFLREMVNQLTQDSNAAMRSIQRQRSQYFHRRGDGIKFNTFAKQTQNKIKHELSGLTLDNTDRQQSKESKRKLRLRHEGWVQEQKQLAEKVKEAHCRRLKQDYSEYDWHNERLSLENEGSQILKNWVANHGRKKDRDLQVLKRLNGKKYSQQRLPRCCLNRG